MVQGAVIGEVASRCCKRAGVLSFSVYLRPQGGLRMRSSTMLIGAIATIGTIGAAYYDINDGIDAKAGTVAALATITLRSEVVCQETALVLREWMNLRRAERLAHSKGVQCVQIPQCYFRFIAVLSTAYLPIGSSERTETRS